MLPAPNWVDGRRALNIVAKALGELGLTYTVQARMLDEPKDAKPVMLPGFTIFDHCNGIFAADWCVPRPRVDRDEVVMIYEEYVDRPLGRLPVPDRVARRVYAGAAADTFFGPRCADGDWWTPAAKLVAIASSMTRTPAVYYETSVSLDLGDCRMSAAPDGCWSNFMQRVRVAPDLAHDASMDGLRVPLLITNHPLAKAVAGENLSPAVLWAINSAIRTESAEAIPTIKPIHVGFVPRKKRSKSKVVGTTADVVGAIAACRELLDEQALLMDLYRVAVPILMSGADFSDLLAPAWKDSNRRLNTALIQKAHEFLDLKEGDLRCRHEPAR